EDGEYAAFRQKGSEMSLIANGNPRNFTVSTGITFEVEAYGKNMSLGGSFIFPGIIWRSGGYSDLYLSMTMFGRWKKFSFCLQYVLDGGLGPIPSAGLSYQFLSVQKRKKDFRNP